MSEECRRCEDDVEDRGYRVSEKLKLCSVCGAPADRELDGRWFCARHYVLALASGRR